MHDFKVGDVVVYLVNCIGVIGCIHEGVAYMSKSQSPGSTPYEYPQGSHCEEHKTFMGYSLNDLKLVEQGENNNEPYY